MKETQLFIKLVQLDRGWLEESTMNVVQKNKQAVRYGECEQGMVSVKGGGPPCYSCFVVVVAVVL